MAHFERAPRTTVNAQVRHRKGFQDKQQVTDKK
nr:MAG TPA: hypothetical protein [Caudoviricetes sp.]